MVRRTVDPRKPEVIRDDVLAQFPWVIQPDQNMVVGCDLDALLSAAFMYHHFNWQPIGVYNLKSIYIADGYSNNDIKNAIWVDLDIYRSDIKSIGHHILTNRSDEVLPQHTSSLNPNLNLLREVSVGQFAKKYPLSTQMWLMWLTNKPAPGKDADPYLLWLPDSCWITAQDRWLPNVRNWITTYLPHPFLVETLELPQTEKYEQGMMRFLAEFAVNVPLQPGRGQTRSKWLSLTGYQCRYTNPAVQNEQVQKTLNYLAQLAGWKVMPFPQKYREIEGTANRHSTNLVDFLNREEVFSYAIPNAGVISYTSFNNF